MYSPTARVLTVLELLQSHDRLSGRELARRLEVDPRTIRRYIVRLQDMGIPIEAEHGPHGAYRLRRGFKLPPLMFTDGEAVALTLGLLAIRDLHLPVELSAVAGALAKTERVLPDTLLAQVQALQEAVTFHTRRHPEPIPATWVTQLSRAVQQGHQVQIRYQTQGTLTERLYAPYGLIMHEGYWYTAGYCQLRQDVRIFRLDRIQSLEPSQQTFVRPADFDVLAHVLQGLNAGPETEPVEILIQATLGQVQAVLWRCPGELEATAEGVFYRRTTYHLEAVALFVLSLSFPLEVRSPQALRDLLHHKAQQIFQCVGTGPDQPESPARQA